MLAQAIGTSARREDIIYNFHHNMIESTEQKVQQKSTQKRKKITTMEQVYI